MKKLLGCLIVLAVSFLFIPDATNAFAISPIKFHLTVAPGTANQKIILRVKNDEAAEKYFSLKVIGAKQNDKGQLVYGANFDEAEKWVKPEKSALEVLPGKEKEAVFLLSIPADALPGSHWLGLAVEEINSSGGQKIGLTGQLVAPLLLQVSGVVNEKLAIAKWSPPGLVFSKIWPMDLSLKNESPTEVPLSAELSVTNWLGQEVYKNKINIGALMLPAAERSFHFDLPLAGGRYLPGPHRVEIRVFYGRTTQMAVSSGLVWYLPPYVWVLAALIVGVFGYIIFRKKN